MTMLRGYVFTMLFINLGFILLNLTGIFPITLSIAGLEVVGNMNADVIELQTTFENASSGLDYLEISGYVIVVGGKLLIQFFCMVFFGVGAIFSTIGFPSAIVIPISVCIGGVMLYECGMLLLGRD